MNGIEPTTDEEWQEAGDAAFTLLLLDSARAYGFIEGGPTIDVERCEAIVKQAGARGIAPKMRLETILAIDHAARVTTHHTQEPTP